MLRAENKASKNNRIIFLIIVLFLIAIMVLSGLLMLWDGSNEKKDNICVILNDSSSSRWTPFITGVNQAAKDYGVHVDIATTGNFHSISEEKRAIDSNTAAGANGIIVDPVGNITTDFVSEITAGMPVAFINSDLTSGYTDNGNYSCISTDNYEIGRAIANEILIDNENDLTGIKVGILTGNLDSLQMERRLEGFKEVVIESGGEIVWESGDSATISNVISYNQSRDKAEIIAAMNNDMLETAVDYVLTFNEENTDKKADNIALYGEGCSDKNIYYLDKGIINSMIFPNEFTMGYESVYEVVNRLQNRQTSMENKQISFKVVNRDNMYDKENQELLFPIVQ